MKSAQPIGRCPLCSAVIIDGAGMDLSRVASAWDLARSVCLVHPAPACDWFMRTGVEQILRQLVPLRIAK